MSKKKNKIISFLLVLLLMILNFTSIGSIRVANAQSKNLNEETKANNSLLSNETMDKDVTSSAAVKKTLTSDGKVLDIVEITDFHGQLKDSKDNLQIGAALAEKVKEVKASNENTLVIGGGDLYQGTPVSNVLKGVPVQKVLSEMGMEVTTLGNHEFDWGLDTIDNTTMDGANYSIVCSNLYKKNSNERKYDPYKIINKNGIRIAVIGGILNDVSSIVLPANIKDYEVKDLASEINKCASEIKEKDLADVTIAVVHEGKDPLNNVVKNLNGNVDAVFGGHSHSIYDDIGSTFNEVIGHDEVQYTSTQKGEPFGESELGNWMADVVKNKAVADIGIVNNGGIRLSPIVAGDITVGTIFKVMPFDNTITTVKMNGAQLKKLVEQGIADNTGKGLQISGVKIIYDNTKQSYVMPVKDSNGNIIKQETEGERVKSIVWEKDNSEIKDTDVFTVGAPDFVSTGGDNFTEFTVDDVKSTYVDSHILVRDALLESVKENNKIVVNMNNRIVNEPSTSNSAISIVATSDIHGNILSFDYSTNAAPSKGMGLAKVSTYVKNLRANNPNVMLIDNGDMIQGTPLSYYYDMIDKTSPYPISKVMGAMGYDTETLGNHEFNYGLDTLNRFMDSQKSEGINILSANIYDENNNNFVNPYYIKSFNIDGNTVKVGILGLTTKCIPNWEDPEHYKGLHFNDLVSEAKKYVPIMKNHGADIVIVAAHSGEEGAADTIPENQVKAIATEVSGIDAIVAGHAHSTFTDNSLKNPDGKIVPVIEPGKWGNNISQIDIQLDSNKVKSISTKNIAMDSSIAEDSDIVSIIAPYQEKTLKYTSTIIGKSTGEFSGKDQTTKPTAIMDLINKVQANAAGTQLSIAAPLSASAYIPSGDITIKDVIGVYVFENYLYGIKMTGKQIKTWLEYSARYYKQASNENDPIVKDQNFNVPDYNLDQLYGATYDIDLTKPVGNRIVNLKYNGKLIKDTDTFTVAINDYRYNGGGGFMKEAGISNTNPSIVTYSSAKKLGDDGQVRSLMTSYIKEKGVITPDCTNNWKLSTKEVKAETSNSSSGSSHNSSSNDSDTSSIIADSGNTITNPNNPASNSNQITKNIWMSNEGKWYYKDEEGNVISNSWKNIGGGWYYFNSDSTMQVGWFKDKDNNWYYLQDSGAMKVGWFEDNDGKWYYLQTNGAMKVGWFLDKDGRWYYLMDNGQMAENQLINGYYLNSNGEWVA
ncbi:bifunctional metallophosphatase/5'-nucleotidase [Clostridium butyricum]|uniref:bifunctional metallophosphatase/5'-nucleotidase n=1 Tax=Clostridium butyricum TaxID=1492 RepID=UPI00168BA518|nr:5'-nucleotidase C-terminal domain-containing protein [Clostridium butyricum]MDB2150450.1 5'-nucleotidase C-terminal domain-containing protein [Clostridium butyricum]